MREDLVHEIARHVSEVRTSEPMARHTTYRVGGPAAVFATCQSLSELRWLVGFLKREELEHLAVGKGSNLLVSDSGFDGVIFDLGTEFKRTSREGDRLKIGAGVVLATVVNRAFREGLTGLEWGVGIPGTVGGALAMNAGSRDEWIGFIVESVTLLRWDGELVVRHGADIDWGYRESGLTREGVIVETALRVTEGDGDLIRHTMDAAFERRKSTQPFGQASAGSVFKNPPGDSAGRLIESVGLKGTQLGGAMISTVHANFIVNIGGATAADVTRLVAMARDEVKTRHGIELTPEIRFVGTTA